MIEIIKAIVQPLSVAILAAIFAIIAQYFFRQCKILKRLREKDQEEIRILKQKLLNRKRR